MLDASTVVNEPNNFIGRLTFHKENYFAKLCNCQTKYVQTPDLSLNRGEHTRSIIGYAIYCVTCGRNTGYKKTLKNAIDYWNRMENND